MIQLHVTDLFCFWTYSPSQPHSDLPGLFHFSYLWTPIIKAQTLSRPSLNTSSLLSLQKPYFHWTFHPNSDYRTLLDVVFHWVAKNLWSSFQIIILPISKNDISSSFLLFISISPPGMTSAFQTHVIIFPPILKNNDVSVRPLVI